MGERCSVTITLPWPEKMLWVNRRGWGRADGIAHSRARARSRRDGKILGLQKRCRFKSPSIAGLWVFPRRGGIPDIDGCLAAIKGYLDGLTDAGLWEDDRIVEWTSLRRERSEAQGEQRVELTISEGEDG